MRPTQEPPYQPEPLAVRFGAFALDERQGRLLHGGHDIALAPRPFALLCCLLRHPNQLLSREALLDAVWGHRHVSAGILKTTVHTVRDALGDDVRSADCHIETVPRRGYRLVAHVEPWAAMPARTQEPAPVIDAPASRLIGRYTELERLAHWAGEHRLVTVVGLGGVGKTSLVQSWFEQATTPPDGIGWCDLSAISQPTLLSSELARSLRLNLGSRGTAEELVAALKPLAMVIVLDSAEHLVGAVARLAQSILAGAPRVGLVVTSQLPLRIAGEQLLPVGPLPVPPVGHVVDQAQATAYGAVDLLVRRATAIDPRFDWNAEVVGPIVDIARRLDGLPLALEMAAARLPMFGPAALADALAHRLQVLTLAARTAPPRQHTLRAALQWSHGLLAPIEQVVFRRLAVFVGPFTLEMAQQLASDDALGPWRVLDALNELVDRALVVAEGVPRRFRWLESPRAFALEQLAAAGEDEAWRARHARAVAGRFDTIACAAYAGERLIDEALATLRPELGDAREAMAWALANEPATAVALMAAFNFAAQRDGWAERQRLWLRTEEHVTPQLPPTLRARWALGACRFWGGGPEAGRRGAAAAALCRSVGDHVGLHRALWATLSALADGESAQAQALLAELQSIARSSLPAFSLFQGHYCDGARRLRLGDLPGAITAYRQALAYAAEAGDSVGAIDVRIGLADLELAAGNARASIALCRGLVEQLNGTRHRFQLGYVWLNLAAAWLVAGDPAEARIAAGEAWPLADEGTLPSLCDHAAWLAAVEARPGDAARLLGAADAFRATGRPVRRDPNEARAFERAQRMAHKRLGDAAFTRLRAEGSGLPAREVARIALRATERESDYNGLPCVS
ncbi:MAG TPA: winged helix-turn-helix domain-containing protein [Ideonella sp.]|uniref:ATP-binding protein n=1 Tax=Ideonella sp. TaxID=1929293 RepID=UPI002E31AA6B|nr:winged helix-turn-helix domain-containing protein [Ideonella sp.]HEX5683147.1 winged helix-turn-helix domain-containing protein [Ideonella sp.]